jgi:hypothetical protein
VWGEIPLALDGGRLACVVSQLCRCELVVEPLTHGERLVEVLCQDHEASFEQPAVQLARLGKRRRLLRQASRCSDKPSPTAAQEPVAAAVAALEERSQGPSLHSRHLA